METKVIRKLPELTADQEWSCEQGCDRIKPKHFENVFSESIGAVIERQSEFFYTCQHGHKLEVWDNKEGDTIVLADEYYQAEADKVVKTESIQDTINFLDNEVSELKDSLSEDAFLDNEQSDTLEDIINKSIQFGTLVERRDADKPMPIGEGDWVKAYQGMPELLEPEDGRNPISRELFFKLGNGGGIHHGWYMAREETDEFTGEEELVYCFNANINDELFDEDSVECWMYCPMSYEGEK